LNQGKNVCAPSQIKQPIYLEIDFTTSPGAEAVLI
jgi:hypothetical protein